MCTEMWNCFVIVILLVFTTKYVFSLTDSGPFIVRPLKKEGIENENFQVSVELTENFPFKSCKFKHDQNSVESGQYIDGLEYFENEEKTICKLIIKPMLNKWKGQWEVFIIDSENSDVPTDFNVGMIDNKEINNKISATVGVGSSFKQQCSYGSIYGKVFDPNGYLVSEGPNAGIDIPFVRVKDSGTWICVIQLANTMYQSLISINLTVVDSALVKVSVVETDNQVNLLCHHDDLTSTPCLFETPNGTIIAPHEGVLDDKYEYYGNDIDYDCGLTIHKPLDENDNGFWKCMMASSKHASILTVGANKPQPVGSTNQPNVSIISGNNLTINCNLRLPLTYCYAQSPRGRIFSSLKVTELLTGQYTGLGLGQGDCQITIPGDSVWTNESGVWICGMGALQNLDDIQIPIHVNIADRHFGSDSNLLEVEIGTSVTFFCNSSLGYGLRYCRFTHPSGRSLNVDSKNLLRSSQYSYFGQSLEAGDCGLTVSNIGLEDLGTWVCSAAFLGDQFPDEFQDRIEIVEAPLSFGVLIGLSIVMGLVAASLIGGVFYYRNKRRRRSSVFEIFSYNNQMNTEHSNSARSSQSSH